MSARDRIIGKLRSRLSEDGPAAARAAAVDERLGAPQGRAPRPTQSHEEGEAAILQFMAKAEAADATVGRVASMADLPAAVSTELRNRNLGQSVRMGGDPALAALDWGGMEVTQGPGRIEEPATLSVAPFGVA